MATEDFKKSTFNDRAEGCQAFHVIGLDYLGRITYKKSPKAESKAYVLLYACSLTRAVCLDLMNDLSLEEFISSLKRIIARRAQPEKICSDNFSKF